MSTEQEQQEAGKENKKFEGFMKKLVALLSGDSLLKRGKKLPKNDVAEAMGELLKEKKAAKVVELKAEMSQLIEEYISFDKFQKEKKKEFDRAIEDKKKEFNKKAEALFAKLEGVEEMETDYYNALRDASGANRQAPPSQLPQPDPE